MDQSSVMVIGKDIFKIDAFQRNVLRACLQTVVLSRDSTRLRCLRYLLFLRSRPQGVEETSPDCPSSADFAPWSVRDSHRAHSSSAMDPSRFLLVPLGCHLFCFLRMRSLMVHRLGAAAAADSVAIKRHHPFESSSVGDGRLRSPADGPVPRQRPVDPAFVFARLPSHLPVALKF